MILYTLLIVLFSMVALVALGAFAFFSTTIKVMKGIQSCSLGKGKFAEEAIVRIVKYRWYGYWSLVVLSGSIGGLIAVIMRW